LRTAETGEKIKIRRRCEAVLSYFGRKDTPQRNKKQSPGVETKPNTKKLDNTAQHYRKIVQGKRTRKFLEVTRAIMCLESHSGTLRCSALNVA